MQDRLVAFGAPAVVQRRGAARISASLVSASDPPTAAFALERLTQGEVDREEVDRLQRRRLVTHLAYRVGDGDRGHRARVARLGEWATCACGE
jgi:hypothetical protein